VFKFIDILGCELHTINDHEDKLPIPAIRQVISLAPSRMRVESVALSSINPAVYNVGVRSVPTLRYNPPVPSKQNQPERKSQVGQHVCMNKWNPEKPSWSGLGMSSDSPGSVVAAPKAKFQV